MMLNSKSIGNKITKARKRINLSQAELAKQVIISPQAVGKWERGESMPDLLTLNQLAEIFGLDLNYFSDSFQSTEARTNPTKPIDKKSNWDMSKMNLVDNDFSGLKNLYEKLSSSNMQRCFFIGSDLSELTLKKNHIEGCDFSDSDLSKSQIHNSMLNKNTFKNCNIKDGEFYKSHLNECDLSGADLTKTTFNACYITKNEMKNVKLSGSSFIETGFQEIVFEGAVADCSFQDCTFHKVQFQNATITNTFFKNNKKFKQVQFSNCKADKLTYGFLKSNLANLTGITIIE